MSDIIKYYFKIVNVLGGQMNNINDLISNKELIPNKLKEGLTAFSNLTKIPVTFDNKDSEIVWECFSENKLCSCFQCFSDCSPTCQKNLSSAIRIASQLKEPYIFLCDMGQTNIAYPVIVSKHYEGCIFAGPISMGRNTEGVIKHLSERLPKNEFAYSKLILYLSQLKVYSPTEVSYIYEVFHDIILSAILPNNDYSLIYENINDHYSQNISNAQAESIEYPYQLEIDLIEGIKSGNVKMIKEIFKDFFDIICAIEAGNLSFIKIRLMGIYGQVSRLISKETLSGNTTLQYLDSLETLNSAMTYKSAFEVSLDLFCNISEVVSAKNMDGHSPIIIKAIRYISEHYSDNISLETTAKFIHTNATYLSSLFKKEIGMTFTTYLSQLRIHQSLRLLTDTNIDLTSISYSVGFNSQSYFTKVFREIMNCTPTSYRKKAKLNRLNI